MTSVSSSRPRDFRSFNSRGQVALTALARMIRLHLGVRIPSASPVTARTARRAQPSAGPTDCLPTERLRVLVAKAVQLLGRLGFSAQVNAGRPACGRPTRNCECAPVRSGGCATPDWLSRCKISSFRRCISHKFTAPHRGDDPLIRRRHESGTPVPVGRSCLGHHGERREVSFSVPVRYPSAEAWSPRERLPGVHLANTTGVVDPTFVQQERITAMSSTHRRVRQPVAHPRAGLPVLTPLPLARQ